MKTLQQRQRARASQRIFQCNSFGSNGKIKNSQEREKFFKDHYLPRVLSIAIQNIKESLAKKRREYFSVAPQELDLDKSEEASRTINQWIKEQTEGKIKDLIEPNILDRLTKLVLVNAVYFKGEWEQKFDKPWWFGKWLDWFIRNRDSYVTPDHVVQVDMMLLNKKKHPRICESFET